MYWTNKILELHETNARDESIKSYEYDEYQSIGTQLNSAGQITITIENQDQFLHLHNSFLLIEGSVLKADDTWYADADLITLTNNGLLHLCSSLKLTLAGQEVEHVNYLGQATTRLGLASYSTTYSKGYGLAQGWYPDINAAAALTNTGFTVRHGYLIEKPDPKGSFQCAIPMRRIFGFMDDYSKVTYGMRDTLQLIHKDDADALFRTAAAGAGKVKLSKIAWCAPIVQPNDVRKVNLYKSIASNNVIPVSFRMRQCETFTVPQATSAVWRLGVSSAPGEPRWVLVGMQTDKGDSQVRNAGIFYHCNITNMQVWLNHSRYPSLDMATDFATEQFAGVYKSFYDFASRYYGIDNLLPGSGVSSPTFKSLYPIHVFDVSKQSERLTEGVVDLSVRMEFSLTVLANTQAYALVISDRMLKFKSVGSTMSVLLQT